MCQRSTEERGAPRLRGYGDGAYRQAPEAGKRGGIPIDPQQAVGGRGEPRATNRGARNGRERYTLILTRLFYCCY